jgi:hypothetical protein
LGDGDVAVRANVDIGLGHAAAWVVKEKAEKLKC